MESFCILYTFWSSNQSYQPLICESLKQGLGKQSIQTDLSIMRIPRKDWAWFSGKSPEGWWRGQRHKRRVLSHLSKQTSRFWESRGRMLGSLWVERSSCSNGVEEWHSFVEVHDCSWSKWERSLVFVCCVVCFDVGKGNGNWPEESFKYPT